MTIFQLFIQEEDIETVTKINTVPEFRSLQSGKETEGTDHHTKNRSDVYQKKYQLHKSLQQKP